MSTAPTPQDPNHHLAPAALVGAAIVLVGASGLTAIMTWHWESQLLAITMLLASNTAILVAIHMLSIEAVRADTVRHHQEQMEAEEQRHQELMAADERRYQELRGLMVARLGLDPCLDTPPAVNWAAVLGGEGAETGTDGRVTHLWRGGGR